MTWTLIRETTLTSWGIRPRSPLKFITSEATLVLMVQKKLEPMTEKVTRRPFFTKKLNGKKPWQW